MIIPFKIFKPAVVPAMFFYAFNNAAIAGSGTYTNNIVLNCAHSSTAGSGFFGVWNNAAIAGDLIMSSNTFSNLVVQNTSGAINPLYNTGAGGRTN